MAADNDTFLDALKKSRLLTGQRLDEAAQVIRSAPDAASAAARLQEGGYLTSWQAAQLLRGNAALAVGDGMYRLLDEPGPWPWGRFFVAESSAGDRVFLKLLSSKWTGQQNIEKTLLASVAKLRKVAHPSLVVFTEVGRAGKHIFLVSAACGAFDLATAQSRWGAVGNLTALRILSQLAAALELVHERLQRHGYVHPSTIRVDEQGQVFLMDSGLAAVVEPWLEEAESQSATGRYLPPRGSNISHVSARADLYALGRIVQELVSAAHISTIAPPPAWQESSDNRDIAEALPKILHALTEPESPEAITSAGALLARCQAVLHCALQCAPQGAAISLQPAPSAATGREESAATADSAATRPEQDAGGTSAIVSGTQLQDSGQLMAASTAAQVGASSLDVSASARELTDSSASKISIRIETAPRKGKKSSKGTTTTGETSETSEETVPLSASELVAMRRRRAQRRLVLSAVGVVLVPIVLLGAYVVFSSMQKSGQLAQAKRASPRTGQQVAVNAQEKAAGAASPAAGPAKEIENATASVPEGPADPQSGNALPEPPPDPQPQKNLPEPPPDPVPPANTSPRGVNTEAAATSPPPQASAGVAGAASGAAQPSPGPENAAAAGTAAPASQNQNSVKGSPGPAPPTTATANSSGTTPPAANTTSLVTASPSSSSAPTSTTSEPRAPTTDILNGLPTAVELPDVGVSDPTVLAPMPSDDTTPIYMELIGGDRVVRGAKLVIENAAGGTAARQWDVFLVPQSEGARRKRVGQFEMLGGQFRFHWTPDAAQEKAAGSLANCLLRLRSGMATRVVSLRKPLLVKPLRMEMDQATFSGRYEIPNVPDPDICRLEILSIEGVSMPLEFRPSGAIPAASSKQWILFGQKREQQSLAIHLTCSLRQTLMISGTALYQMGEDPSEEWLKARERKPLKAVRARFAREYPKQLTELKQQLETLLAVDARRITDRNKQQELQRQQNLAKGDFEKLEAEWKRIQEVDQLCSLLDGKSIHFRVIFELEGQPIELLRSEGSPSQK